MRRLIRPTLRLLALNGLLCYAGVAQSVNQSIWQAQLDVGGWAATGEAMPFWLRANQNGTIPLTTPAATLRASFWKPYAQPDTTTQPTPADLTGVLGYRW